MSQSRRTLGQAAEKLAETLFRELGFEILFRNWRRPQAEIDLVAMKDGLCVFVEVRSRTGQEHGHALETVTRTKRAQVVRAARIFLSEETPPGAREFRFDVVAVTFDESGQVTETLHVPGAFDTNE
jgi:putative endonuclease